MSQAEVWSALPAGAHRFGADDEIIVRGSLGMLGLDEADLPTLAAEARATWPHLFDRSWSAQAAHEAPRERAQRLAGLAP